MSGLVTFVEVIPSQQSTPSMFEQRALPHVWIKGLWWIAAVDACAMHDASGIHIANNARHYPQSTICRHFVGQCFLCCPAEIQW